MNLLYPIGLLALTALLVPIIIHLWRIKQGKTFKVGSISLMGESAASNARSFVISDWLLLLLRCLLLALLALLLAQPFLKGKPLAKQSGWILIAQQNLKATYQNHRKTIDSLLNKGFEFRHLGLGFKSLSLNDTTNATIDSLPKLSYTSLLKQANHQLPNQYPVWIFAPKTMLGFDEELPKLHLQVHWQTPPLDTLQTYQTSFLNLNLKAQTSGSTITYQREKGPSSPSMQVLLHSDSPLDGKYVRAAINAIGEYLDQPITFYTKSNNQPLDAIFWLAENDVPNDIRKNLKTNGILFKYAKGKAINENSLINFGNSSLGNASSAKLLQRVAAGATGQTLWEDSFGEALLTVQQKQHVHEYTFYSRLNPQWTDLVWKDQFVEVLFPLLYGKTGRQFGFEEQPSTAQANEQPIASFENAKGNPTLLSPALNLEKYLWVVAFLVFLIERLLTYRKQTPLKQA
ncbi:BatA domain-containing protein [Pedobacter sp.]|uniref:BatA domain-containing protein n=1 Tax=Pedobacter sp. TaxID=1411316 RepID=UPI0031D857F2